MRLLKKHDIEESCKGEISGISQTLKGNAGTTAALTYQPGGCCCYCCVSAICFEGPREDDTELHPPLCSSLVAHICNAYLAMCIRVLLVNMSSMHSLYIPPSLLSWQPHSVRSTLKYPHFFFFL